MGRGSLRGSQGSIRRDGLDPQIVRESTKSAAQCESARRAKRPGRAIIEFDVMDPRTPPELRSWGSPTILVDGLDVIGGFPSDPCCRVYCDGEQKGPPPLAAIEDALRRSAATRKQSF